MPGEEFLVMQMHELLAYTNQMGVATITTLAQHGIVGPGMSSPVDLSYLADCVLLFRYFEAGGAVKQAISVIKKRTGNHERTLRELSFRTGKIQIGRPLDEFEGVLTGVPRYRGTTQDLNTRATIPGK